MRLPGKRELAALYLIYSRGPDMNYYAAIDLLRSEMCMNKKTARNIVKRLRKIGALTVYMEGGELRVRAEHPWSYLEEKLKSYISGRRSRRMGPCEVGRTL